ncbi:hypothetical protein HN51_059138, partial [Arachis hypogaea]
MESSHIERQRAELLLLRRLRKPASLRLNAERCLLLLLLRLIAELLLLLFRRTRCRSFS